MAKPIITRQQESELPAVVQLQFLNQPANYQTGTQRAVRMSTTSVQAVRTDMAIVLNDIQAKAIVETMLYNVWIERDRFTLPLPRKYTYLEPTDVITLVDAEDGYVYKVRIVKTAASRNGTIEIEGVADHAPSYRQNPVASQATVVEQTPLVNTPSIAAFLDIPLLRDSDIESGWYIAMAGSGPVWAGGAIYQSIDGGATYEPYLTANTPAVMGRVASALGAWVGGNVFDETNSVTVTPTQGELSSSTTLGVLNGSNLIAIGSGTGWEIIQFRTAALIPGVAGAPDSYLLTGLLRGRFGTEQYTDGHSGTDPFVLLSTTAVQRTAVTSAQIESPILYKVLTLGQQLGAVDGASLINHGVSLKPYAPVQIGAGQTATGDIVVQWVRRTRIGGSWSDGVDVPVSEESETYDVEFYSDPSYTTLVRTVTGITSPTTTYSVGDQTTDGVETARKVYFKVFQVSSTLGRGFEGRGFLQKPL